MFSLSLYLVLSLVSIIIYSKYESKREKLTVFRDLNTKNSHYLTESRKILKNHKFIYFQTLNSKFLKLTKNWICQVSDKILSQTLFIVTDQKSFETIKNHTNHVIRAVGGDYYKILLKYYFEARSAEKCNLH